MNDQQLLKKLKWCLAHIERKALESEQGHGGYPSGLRDARKLIESAFYVELGEYK